MKLNKLTLACLTLGSGLLLSACGSGESSPEVAATTDAVATFNAKDGKAIAAAVTGETFTFPADSAFGGTATGEADVVVDSLQFVGSMDAPRFNMAIQPPNTTLTGNLEFGSCIFKAAERTITADTCKITFATTGLKSTGDSATVGATLTLDAASSRPTPVTLSINPDRTVTVGGIIIPVTIVFATGTGS